MEHPQNIRIIPALVRHADGQPMTTVVDAVLLNGDLTCPTCKDTTIEAGDRYLYPNNDQYDSPAGTRGEFAVFLQWCGACGCDFALVIGNHKGVQRVQVVL